MTTIEESIDIEVPISTVYGERGRAMGSRRGEAEH